MWEYLRIYAANSGSFMKQVEEHGRSGWELITVVHEGNSILIDYVGYMKRRMDEEKLFSRED
jgi:hypothetical protein